MNPIVLKIPRQEQLCSQIYIESNLLAHPDRWLPRYYDDKKVVIITDDIVKTHYGDLLLHKLSNKNTLLLSFTPGEESKNHRTKQFLESKMLASYCDRDTLILALGGGVVGDMAGFVAATYMRGVSYIQIPTTLLAMVDSSVGGKTAINTPQSKNAIGAFWHPSRVVIDVKCLFTLPKVQLVNGLVEAIKMFTTSDFESFNDIRHLINNIFNGNISDLENIVKKAISIKVKVVGLDEKDNRQRNILNFGHTIGHALEQITGYTLLHGYAVGIGILVEAKISELLGLLSPADYQSIQSLLMQLDISGSYLKKFNLDEVIMVTKSDKKANFGHARYVLLKGIGDVFCEGNSYAHSVSEAIVKEALTLVSEV